MAMYDVTRQRLVTERFRVTADNDEEAEQIVQDAEIYPITDECECVEVSTLHSEIEIVESGITIRRFVK
jgi:hypothetical protein